LLFTAPEDADLPVKAWRIGRVNAPSAAPLTLDGTAIDTPDGLGYQH